MLELETADFTWFSIFVALNTLLLLLLSLNISRLRIINKIANGDGDNKTLRQAIRAHGNGIEHTPIYGLAILALSFLQLGTSWLATLVLAFTVARLLHAYGMLFKHFNARRVGSSLTFLLQGISVVALFLCL